MWLIRKYSLAIAITIRIAYQILWLNVNNTGNSADKLRMPRSAAYSAAE